GSGLGATTWSWSGPNGFTSTVQNPEISSVTTAASGIYTLTASNACGSATAVNTSAVTVNNIPTGASAAATPNPICAGQTLSLTGSATGATSWSWAGPNSYTSSSQNPSISSVTTAAAGTYTLTASNSCGSATAVNTASVTVNITPSVPTAATHTPSETQIVWNWNTVAGATGYKWSTTNNYATATNMGTSTTKTETSLTCNTAYTRYVWAYNDCGNSAVLTLTEITSACPIANCGIITDARDGNIYQTVLIGSQCWMAENLAYLPTVHSNTEFETQGNNSQPGYGVYGYDGSDVPTAKTEANYSTYGVLYNWWAAMQGESTCNGSGPPPNDSCLTPVKGICPAGWHLPSHYEWTTLERAVCSSGSCTTDFPYDVSTTGERGTDEGSKLAGNAGLWTNGTLDSHASFGTSGFSGLPGGSRSTNGAYYNIANYAYWWSSTEYSAAGAWTRVLAYGGSSVFRTNPSKEYGFSVRCVRDL
ncbi:MAG: hypothetical protein KKD31_15960, partial [Bacteroidetes bacterium]|nr:hypothetical protein [Bacteroidota bacterium]